MYAVVCNYMLIDYACTLCTWTLSLAVLYYFNILSYSCKRFLLFREYVASDTFSGVLWSIGWCLVCFLHLLFVGRESIDCKF